MEWKSVGMIFHSQLNGKSNQIPWFQSTNQCQHCWTSSNKRALVSQPIPRRAMENLFGFVVGVHGKITKKSGGNPGEPVTAGWSNNQALHQKWTAGYMFIHFGFHWVFDCRRVNHSPSDHHGHMPCLDSTATCNGGLKSGGSKSNTENQLEVYLPRLRIRFMVDILLYIYVIYIYTYI